MSIYLISSGLAAVPFDYGRPDNTSKQKENSKALHGRHCSNCSDMVFFNELLNSGIQEESDVIRRAYKIVRKE